MTVACQKRCSWNSKWEALAFIDGNSLADQENEGNVYEPVIPTKVLPEIPRIGSRDHEDSGKYGKEHRHGQRFHLSAIHHGIEFKD